MEWLNENAGLIVLIGTVLILALVAVVLYFLFDVRKKIAVQRLNFLGFYGVELETRQKYAELTIGNKSINEVALAELGIRNGKVSFDFTEIYRRKAGIAADTRIVVEQRSALHFRLSEEELKKVLVEGKNGKSVLKKLQLYAVDLTGNLYKGNIRNVRALLLGKGVQAAEERVQPQQEEESAQQEEA